MPNGTDRFSKIADAICPQCQGDLLKSPEKFTCRLCSASYQVIRDVPILYKPSHQVLFEAPAKGLELPLKMKLGFLKPIFSLKLPLATRSNLRYMEKSFKNTDRLLLLGGGTEHHGWFIRELGQELLDHAVNLEVEPGHFVDLVSDAHDIPFPDNSFDGIICQSVLEHTKDSERVVAEAHRVLKPGGIIYAEVPFLQPVHMTSDFRRYTLLGLDNLFSDFEKVKSGINAGIGSVFSMVAVNFFAMLLSFNSWKLYRSWRLIFRILFAPVKVLDLLLVKYSMAPITTSENYYIGRKK
ncbi:MAG: class I SAM-dependent methyltransferase [bacterium]|nr:class I SAM-dependent methyltransferase [bacterium]